MKNREITREMQKNQKDKAPYNVRLDPESRICPLFDSASIALFPVASPGEMGFRVLDNFCEEHQM